VSSHPAMTVSSFGVAPLDACVGFVLWHMPELQGLTRLWHNPPASTRSPPLCLNIAAFASLARPGRRTLTGPRSEIASPGYPCVEETC
jgi:hypothetical protein